eukprot:6094336-Prymnesium_polylepis.1
MRPICRFIIFIAVDTDQGAQCEDLRDKGHRARRGGAPTQLERNLSTSPIGGRHVALDRRLEEFFLRAVGRLRESTFLNMVFS